MKARRFAGALASIAFALFFSAPASARDWFVRAGATDGDGSQAKPFSDPWQALGKCEAGDAIHIAGGKYYGQLGAGTWAIPYDGVQLVGGYDASFQTRDPWKNPTMLAWDKTSKNWPKEERLTSNAKNVVVDGITIDMRDQNQYADAAETGRADAPAEGAIRLGQPATVRNCVVINSGEHAIEVATGSTVENDLVLNALGWGVTTTGNANGLKTPTVIRNNTILFSWDPRKPGFGGYDGAAVAVRGPAVITNNILAHSDNNAVYVTVEAEKVSITKNDFFMSLFSNVKFYVEGRDMAIDDHQMDQLEEVGLKAWDGNVVANPQLDLDPKWMDKFSRRTSEQEGKLEMDDWNKMRQTLGLPMIAKGGAAATGVAPPWDLDKALKLLQPKNPAITQGARRVKLEVKLSAPVAAGPAKSYQRIDLAALAAAPEKGDGKAVELLAAVGGVGNIGQIPSQYSQDDHAGIFLYDRNGTGTSILGFYRKGSNADRVVSDATGYYQGEGKPDRLFVVRGTAYNTNGIPHAAVFIDAIEPFAAPVAGTAPRPQGRDWFVRANAQGGDGSREKPFRDPWQALEKAESGDTIHVAEGEYFGKLHAGNWKIDTTYVSLLGGYDADFKTRNPWKHPTLLRTGDDFKGRRGGYTIEGEGDHTGTVIDGFVFDKKGNNLYDKSGDLQYSESDKSEHIWLARPGCVIRNCVFLNGAEGALRLGGNGQLVENDIFLNHMMRTVKTEGGFGNDPFVFRNNTVAFSWDIRFGQGKGSNGNLIILATNTRAILENNIFEFADNDAIRLDAQAKDVELVRNTFNHNLWSDVQRPSDWSSIDDKDFAKLGDFGWHKLEGNQVVSAALPVDQKWFDVYLHRTAMVPGKVTMDDWNQMREILGQPVIATGGQAGTGLAPAYDWKKAVAFFPKNPKVTAGARAKDLPVSFTGVARTEETHDYQDVTWEVAKDRDAWEKLAGKRVALTVVIRSNDNQYQLDDVKEADFQCFTVSGPEGIDSGGLPLRVYVKRGSKYERVVNQAKGYSSGTPAETHVIKGIVRSNRQMVAEVVEKGD